MGLFRVSRSRNKELRGESEGALKMMMSYGLTDQEVMDEIFVKTSDSYKKHIEVKGDSLSYMRGR